MSRQEVLNQIEQAFGYIPEWFEREPDAVLEQHWTSLGWMLADTKLSARDKALVGFGAASAVHCQY